MTKDNGEEHETPLLCVICGSLAAGVYYKVRSCDGCRSFFRRMIQSGQRNHSCVDRDNRTMAECRAKTNCKKCRFALCLLAGMRPWYLREARDIAFPFPYLIPLAQSSDNCKERQTATLLHADVAHENSRLSKYDATAEQRLSLASVLSSSAAYHNHVNHANHVNHVQAIPVQMDCNPPRKKDRLGADLACAVEYIKAFEFFTSLAAESKGMHRISMSIQEASIIKALILRNPAIDGIAATDLRILKEESEAYGKMLFRVLSEKRGSSVY